MEKSFGNSDSKIGKYIDKIFQPEDEILRRIREKSTKESLPEIQVGALDSLHLEVIARGLQARKIVEIGTLGGYSGVAFCRALPSDGKLFTLESNPRHARVAEENFHDAGFRDKVEILLGPALENLPRLKKYGPFDLVFLDADKVNYCNYFRWAAENIRSGGAILADNTFAWGLIAEEKFDSSEDETAVNALKEYNRLAATDKRFRSTVIPTGEGLTFSVKL